LTDISMTTANAGQMLWMRQGEDQFLHLRHHDAEPWRPYEEFPQYALPDPQGFSKGITTFVTLVRQGWVTVKAG
jgi:hypothetical protein